MTFGDCEEMCNIFDDCDFGDRDGCRIGANLFDLFTTIVLKELASSQEDESSSACN